MSPRIRFTPAIKPPFALLATLLVSGCTSIGDFGRLQSPLVTDDIHAWVGQEAAAHAGAPVSVNNLTDDERTLRDLAFPLIEPPYDRVRWDAVVYEYGQKRAFRRDLWTFDTAAYYAHLMGEFHRSSIGALQPVDRRYAQRHRAHRSVLPDRAARGRCRSAARKEHAIRRRSDARRNVSVRWRASAKTA